ncbi:tRNA (adenosine(37)-N6)-dimethylallyltransferase MiaA [Thermosulfurimonas marina]|uniref:tRNA dimethylallyltransferase n=1 Tax=Thermosulfurimonas marina TaxID=2047767 RepID=A0A6H1WTU8_9BACT|nr:tRNA (adenosine(37)-N6)-dimethylallyltransferase MiaA [Thermosulfurimonas marina]QJA06622.1 tRNA (adenosine(37)-N6)-dimethylallyltransferase MiaA [Thermosulfurimonas marina]
MNSTAVSAESEKPRVVAVVGPTGVGKSALAIELAERFGGEVVNFDSVQVYRGLDIGTAKPGPEERSRVPHHLFDFLEPWEEFNAAAYAEKAQRVVREIVARGRLPVLAGGTGLYLKALLHGLFPVEVPREIREALRQRLEKAGLSALYAELSRVDPEAARRIHPHDRVRVLRALEVFYATGRPFSALAREHAFRESRFQALKIGLYLPREELYRRLEARVEEMLSRGLLEEVRGLLSRGLSPELKPLQSIGYRHMIAYLTGKLPWEEAVRLMKRDTRRYAKRQLTWFRADPEVHWFQPQEKEKIFRLVEKFLSS